MPWNGDISFVTFLISIRAQGETQMQHTGGRWFESLIVIIIQGAGKRMVVDRQKIITRSESRRYRVTGRLEAKQYGQAGGFRIKCQNQED